MAAHGARRLVRMNCNLNTIIGVELMCAAQGVEFRAPLKTSPRLQKAMNVIRAEVPSIEEDRYMADDIARASGLAEKGVLIDVLELSGFVTGDAA